MGLKYLVCEICGEVIGQFDPEKLSLPLTGAMFLPADILHDFPAPFPAELEWVDLRCPMCRKRPFLEEDRVMTLEGYWMVEPIIIQDDPGRRIVDEDGNRPEPIISNPESEPARRMVDEVDLYHGKYPEPQLIKPEITGTVDEDTGEKPELGEVLPPTTEPQSPLAGTANEGYNPDSGASAEHLCQMCGRTFTKRMALVGHMKGHRKEKRGEDV